MGNSCCCSSGKKENANLGSPIQNRRCTDIPCCIVFFVFMIGMLAIAGYCWVKGDIVRLLNGYDDYGNVCGVDNTKNNLSHPLANKDMTDRPYLFFTNYLHPDLSTHVCVKQCPDEQLDDMSRVNNFSLRTGSLLCDYNVELKNYPTQSSVPVVCWTLVPDRTTKENCYGPCPAFPIPVERPLLHRCLPSIEALATFAKDKLQMITQFFQRYAFFYQFGMDFVVVKWDLLISAGLSLALSLLIVFLMRFVIKVMVWFVVALAAAAAIGVTAALWVVYARLMMGIDPQEQHVLPIVAVTVSARSAFLAYAIVSTIFTAILLLVILVMRKRLALAVALFREAGKCLETMPTLLLQPIWPYISNLVVIVYAVAVFIFLHSLSVPVDLQQQDAVRNRTIVRYQQPVIVTYLWWYHLVGILWLLIFTGALQQLVIAGAVSQWYFTQDKKSLSCTVFSSTRRALLYHVGSAALGSFIIVMVKLPRYILMWINKKCKASENDCARFTLKCCICCLWCLEKCLKFINRNAYIVIAINSTDFCVARIKAFKTLAENMLRVAAINSVGDFVLFLGKVLVTAANVGIAIALFERHNADKPYGEKQLYLLPLAVVGVLTYAVADTFLSVYEMVVDALLLCFCEDEAINDGSSEKPYFASPSLRELINTTSQKIDALSRKAEPPAAAAAATRAQPEAGEPAAEALLPQYPKVEHVVGGNKVV